jgi:hypothetical protein
LGISKGNQVLAIENRNLIDENADTIFLYTGQMKTANYHLDIIPENIEGKYWLAYLKDNYLNTYMPLNLMESNGVDFTINSDPASYNSSRFLIVFKKNPNLIQVYDIPESDHSVLTRNLNSSINNTSNNRSLVTIYPNPVGKDHRIMVTFDLHSFSAVQVDLLDALGRVVFSKQQENCNNQHSFILNIPSSIPTGSYTLLISEESHQVFAKKIIIK